MMARPLSVPTSYVEMLDGLMLLFFAVAVFVERTVAARAHGEAPDAVDPGASPALGGEPRAPEGVGEVLPAGGGYGR
jgi:hypothetical protein